jgi:micrococcal nuclease
MRGTTDEVKALAMQAQQVTEKALKGASKIELRNPQRGKYFRIVSEVWIDGKSLAEMLKAKGLAKGLDLSGEVIFLILRYYAIAWNCSCRIVPHHW